MKAKAEREKKKAKIYIKSLKIEDLLKKIKETLS